MKKVFLIITIILWGNILVSASQTGSDTLVYLLTCGPGIETYSIYGHSALRIKYPEEKRDLVYNWGVFDFDTPNFAWKFANGRLDYMLAVETMQSFPQTYFFEKRYIICQQLNITKNETARLVALINENLKPDNIKYRYDFFYDDCSTRIRDLIEKTIGEKLLYPPLTEKKSPTFRDLIGKYDEHFPWLRFGINLLVGSPADIKAPYRDRMFLPFYLQKELSEAVVNRDGMMIPLLQNPDAVLDFDPLVIKNNFLLSPSFLFTLLFIVIMILTATISKERFIFRMDMALYLLFSVLAVMMVFFNLFTDHMQLRWNLNIVWLNPVILICLILIIVKKEGLVWFRLLFIISVGFFLFHILLPQSFDITILPLVLIIAIRSSVRAGFKWNPLSLN